jgi:hypothetical protein
MAPSSTSSLSSTKNSSSSSISLSPLQQLKAVLDSQSSKSVLDHCLGLSKMEGVSQLADAMILVCFDTESWTRDHSKLTEIGIATFDSRDMGALEAPGMHGENLLKQVYFYHARIEENAHLLNIQYCPGDPNTNRFGQTRFVPQANAPAMLEGFFKWPIDPTKPELGYCPVIAMGHALKNDFAMLSSTLEVDAAVFDTVVKTIDTQHLCHETGWWNSRQQAGLRTLVEMAGFEYRDGHTASNDAAMTLICAVQMVLPAHSKGQDFETDSAQRSLQDVVDAVEIRSQKEEWSWGTKLYCVRCAKYGHVHNERKGLRCRNKVRCDHCASQDRKQAANSHATKLCIRFASRSLETEPVIEQVTEDLGLMGYYW